MSCNVVRRALLLATGVALAVSTLTAQDLLPIAANDNRTPAGNLRGGVLTLQLELRKGNWHPEREDGETIPVYAFGEAGKTLQIPGPTIRVPQGATIDIALHSTLSVPATLHGLHQRPGNDGDVITVAAGATEHIRFVAGVAGTYSYWARTPDGQRDDRRVVDSLLGGALVVDPPGATRQDRIFVLERWNGPTRTAINGKSWPYTERLNYEVGEKVHWRVINVSDLSHPMHLHGFHFELNGAGDGENYKVFAPGEEPVEFTHSAEIGETFEMTWVPKEPGRWLYHCHRLPHMRLPIALDPSDVSVLDNHAHMHEMDSDYEGMGGMIMGITVTGRSIKDTSKDWKPERRLELAVAERSGDSRFFELSLRDLESHAAKPKAQKSGALSGPVLVLTQNQPVEISVVNKLKEATSIHWHGIELESYYDGVPGWGGLEDKKTPAVEPGETFTVRMAPPRAGTFMYHTHWHDAAQLTGGIHGALIVMAPGEKYDPATDKSFMFSQSPNEPFGAAMTLMNGSPQPETMELCTGTTYRFRFINITPSVNNLRVSLESASGPVEWRLLAKDAANVKNGSVQRADQMIGVGETYDFEYRTTSPQELTLVGLSPNNNRRAVQTLIFSDPAKQREVLQNKPHEEHED
jgi:FtsP/CotA-like multicopper oxidase with cupredoxin domain